ncbi:MAG: hypothetical protein KAU20_07875 [Nanoarchaeota archaeon]|nr:hypothetical protein [Nanoarchaeota archaeon]
MRSQRKCPKCNNYLYKAEGKIRVMGFHEKWTMTSMYYCKVCGFRTI